MRKAIVLSRVSTLQQDLKQQTEEILREVYKDGLKESLEEGYPFGLICLGVANGVSNNPPHR